MNKTTNRASDLIDLLWREVFQAEESARSHPAREAKRLGESPPALAMRAVSEHATASLESLRRLASERHHSPSMVGAAVGRALSIARSLGSDLLVSSEKSYRATVLGIHHGIGVFALLEDAATASGDEQLADFCASWLAERRVLCTAAEEALAWFAENPARAMARAFGSKTAGRAAITNSEAPARAS